MIEQGDHITSKNQERFGPRTRAKTLLITQVPRKGGGLRGWVSLIKQVNPDKIKMGLTMLFLVGLRVIHHGDDQEIRPAPSEENV